MPKKKSLKLLSWNVNGLRAVMKKGFMEFLEEQKPDILGLQETKLQLDQIPKELHELNGYHLYWSCAKRKGYSGVALFTREKPKKVTYSIGEDRFDHEGRVIRAEYKNFVFFNVYFPNGQKDQERLDYKMDFYDRFFDVMQKVVKSGKNIVVCGDYNTAHKEIDLFHPKQNEKYSGFLPIERAWLDKLVENGYVDTFRKFNQEPLQYTWWTYRMGARARNVGWRIDYFFVNKKMAPKLKDAFILQEIMGSDHCPLGIEL